MKIFCFCFLLTAVQFTYGQNTKELALSKGREAVRMEDEDGKFDEAIQLFEEAQKLDPENITYPYEIAYAYTKKKAYKKASDILENLLDHKDIYGLIYQALGNSYDYQGKADKAIEIYEKGIKKFPNSGPLYLEMGNMKVAKKEYNSALSYFERGIENDPLFPSNYYWASKIFCASSESVWGLIYGEIFMNLERNSKRTSEISALLYSTYKEKIKIRNDSSSIDFCQVIINADDVKDSKNMKFPFCMSFGQDFILAITMEKTVELASLNSIRTKFLQSYFKNGHNQAYPNLLYDYQDKMLKAGYFEAYNYWILSEGEKNGFEDWRRENKAKWDDFLKWFTDNPMKVDETHKFYRKQY